MDRLFPDLSGYIWLVVAFLCIAAAVAVLCWPGSKKKPAAETGLDHLGPEVRISDTATYREQPDGSRIVTQTTLAKPVRLEADFRAEGGGSASLNTREQWLASPGTGRLAAKLIMGAPTLEDARDTWSAFYSTEPRTDTHVAGWAFSLRLEDAGQGQEVYQVATDLYENDVDMTLVDDEMQAEIKSWARHDD